MADLSIFRVVGDVSSLPEGSLRSHASDILAKEVARIAKMCQSAARAYVPIYGGELRTAIQILKTSRYESKVVVVEGSHVPHPHGGKDTRRVSSKRGVRISNTLLAEILDEGYLRSSPEISAPESGKIFQRNRAFVDHSLADSLKRSSDALPSPPFAGPQRGDETKDWITLAQNALEEELYAG